MKLTSLFNEGKFVVTSEVGPIKGAISRDKSVEPACAREAMVLKDCVHAVNVTDNQSAVMRLGSLAASVGLKERGIEPVYQLTCRDRNRIALQSDLLTAYSLGIDNVLLLTADRKEKAAEMMGRFLKEIKSMVRGVHIMPLGWTDIVPDILEQTGISISE